MISLLEGVIIVMSGWMDEKSTGDSMNIRDN